MAALSGRAWRAPPFSAPVSQGTGSAPGARQGRVHGMNICERARVGRASFALLRSKPPCVLTWPSATLVPCLPQGLLPKRQHTEHVMSWGLAARHCEREAAASWHRASTANTCTSSESFFPPHSSVGFNKHACLFCGCISPRSGVWPPHPHCGEGGTEAQVLGIHAALSIQRCSQG